MTYDAVIVGGGHNALVAAAYLSRAGKSVLVLERSAEVGGAAVSEEAFPGTGARLSRYAYLVSLFPDRIARDLGLRLDLRRRSAVAYAPDGDVLVRGDENGPLAEFAALTARLESLFATFTEPLPTAAQARSLVGGEAWRELVERPLGETLRERFDDDVLRGMLATDGLIGTFASLDDPGLAQNRCFLYHLIGGPWKVPAGGMGALTAQLRGVASASGAEIRCGAEVVAVDPAARRVAWVEGGEQRDASAAWVLSGVAPAVLARLIGDDAPAPEGCQTKVNLLLDRLPRLRSGVDPEVAFAGTFRLWERESELEAAYASAAAGVVPAKPPAEMYCHTLTDPSIVPDGRHTLTLFGLHTPARLFGGGEEAAVRHLLVERYLDGLDQWLVDPIRDCIASDSAGRPCIEARTPLDLERTLAMPGGDIFHGGLDWPWQPEGGEGEDVWGVSTPWDRVLVCGAGARRGGGVSGVGGHNAAMAVLRG